METRFPINLITRRAEFHGLARGSLMNGEMLSGFYYFSLFLGLILGLCRD